MHLTPSMTKPAQREAIGEMLPEVVAFSSSVPLNPCLWTVLKAAAACDWVKNLSPRQAALHSGNAGGLP